MNSSPKKSTAELVSAYNKLEPAKPLKGWKGSQTELLQRIEKLKKEKEPKKEPKKASKKRTRYVDGAPTIREYSIELLCKVEYYEDRGRAAHPDNRVPPTHANARSVGMPYEDIIKAIKQRWPESETTPECLRWYAVHIRNGSDGYQGFRLAQRRPRPQSPKKAKKS